ncbi:alpha-1,4 glucan phosphorylase L-2 isozyme, chloroplastic/amyloplastic [Tanacetum coccineum]
MYHHGKILTCLRIIFKGWDPIHEARHRRNEIQKDERNECRGKKRNVCSSSMCFRGKSFSTYVQAKTILKFIIDVVATVNHDPDIGDLLKVVFVPDCNVTVAEVLFPGSDLSQHINTSGMEASGMSNKKFAMNGCIQIGTLDGANERSKGKIKRVEVKIGMIVDEYSLEGTPVAKIAIGTYLSHHTWARKGSVLTKKVGTRFMKQDIEGTSIYNLVSADAMFDVQIQKDERNECRGKKRNVCSSSMCFRGKSFSTYVQAKMILKFIIDVVATVNHDPDIGDLLKVVFVPDCNVTVAEVMFPRSDLSQHIRMEATYEIAGLRKERSKGKDSMYDPLFQNIQRIEWTHRTSTTGILSNLRKASSSSNFVLILAQFLLEFQEIEGEPEERRRAMLERELRTRERMMCDYVTDMSAFSKKTSCEKERLKALKALKALLSCPMSSISTKKPARDNVSCNSVQRA